MQNHNKQLSKYKQTAIDLKQMQLKHLGSQRVGKQKRRRSQPSQLEQPDKFDLMYEQHLLHYTKILNGQNIKGERVLNASENIHTRSQIKTKKKPNPPMKSAKQDFLNQINQPQLKKEKELQNSQLMNLLKGMQMDEDMLNEVMKECANMAKDC